MIVRRASALLIGIALALAVTALAPAQARVFRAADNQTEDYPTVEALFFMDRLIRERTGGRHRLQVFHSRQLGEEKDTVEQVRAGALDLNRVNATPLGGMVPLAKVLVMPFLFRSTEHLHHVLDGPIGQQILDSFSEAGFIALTFYDSGARSIYNDVREVRTPADVKGLRLRVQQSDIMMDMMSALGAQPYVLSYGQVPAALETRLIDGAENNWPSYVTTGHYLHARYITLTEHVMTPEVLLMSLRAWDSLSPEDQTVFREAARESSRFMRSRWQAWEEQTRAQAAGAGALITSAFDKAAFVEATRDLNGKYLADPRLRALADRIRDVP